MAAILEVSHGIPILHFLAMWVVQLYTDPLPTLYRHPTIIACNAQHSVLPASTALDLEPHLTHNLYRLVTTLIVSHIYILSSLLVFLR